ncbi:hypothetical protein COV20_03995 [Candidatus Woesearchaeota archaeon CG10_big_fil_rev_8_21_14_0_10_45_16]|nr:MAG: hypothetical protein COV20_03995 [Candidatus Woesearchaeota archaeon CG10_big_fil_rev_8_21_14_0_10_45_16]
MYKDNLFKPKRIAYSSVVGDLFHYGHLQSLQYAKSISDYFVVGVITDEGVESYRAKPVANFEERKAVIENLRCVDRVMVQKTRDHTENLMKLHSEFPDAELILVHGDDIADIHGKDYALQIGGRVAVHPYYNRLSTFKIIQHILEQKDKIKDLTTFSSLIQNESARKNIQNKIIISTKANTLDALRPLLKLSRIEDLYFFTTSDWMNKKERILNTIKGRFGPAKIVIRSSATNEDTLESANAGCYESILNIDSTDESEIEKGIEEVLDSYRSKDAQSSFNQVLVQKQTEGIIMSGVVFTRTLEWNAPYYVINYDDVSGSTDSVTAGRESQSVCISHFCEDAPDNMKDLIKAVKEIEEMIPGIPLDIEFAVTQNGEVIIFQVRPLATNIRKKKNDFLVRQKITALKEKFRSLSVPLTHVEGEKTIFADMPDWNPAEIIGDRPNHLDFSLYDYIITNRSWHLARTSQGYFDVKKAPLVELFGVKPYINVRYSFNSFTPASLPKKTREKLVQFYLEKLKENRHLQDKIEFEIAFTCYDCSFPEKIRELREHDFSDEEIEEIRSSILDLTNRLVSDGLKDINDDLKTVFSLEKRREEIISPAPNVPNPSEIIGYAKLLLDECHEKGTIQFSRLARLGFIGKIILNSLVSKGVITSNLYDKAFSSIETVATVLSNDFDGLCSGNISKSDFLRKYKHLRPGTYDVTSPRYENNDKLLSTSVVFKDNHRKENFVLDGDDKKAIDQELQQHGFTFDSRHLFRFFEEATKARELAKFEFTKNLSDALELVADAGKLMGFTRKEVAMLDINDIFKMKNQDITKMTADWQDLIKAREQKRNIDMMLELPAVIRDEGDFDIVTHYLAKPNFITQKTITSPIMNIAEIDHQDVPNLAGKVVLIENGDPGYDWIFTKNIGGLITKYGGVASHMSIRCAEFGVPAAIGCGNVLFNKLVKANTVTLDCAKQMIDIRGLR